MKAIYSSQISTFRARLLSVVFNILPHDQLTFSSPATCRAFSKYLTSILLYVRESFYALFIIPIISQIRTSLLWEFLPTSRISQVKAFFALDYVRFHVIIRSSTNNHLPTWLPAHQHLLPSNEVGGEVGMGAKSASGALLLSRSLEEKSVLVRVRLSIVLSCPDSTTKHLLT